VTGGRTSADGRRAPDATARADGRADRPAPAFPQRLVAAAGAERLDRFLTEALGMPGISRSVVQRAIARGMVTVDGRPGREAQRLPAGAVVVVAGLPRAEAPSLAPEAIPLRVVYEDEAIAVIDKPRGLVVHPAAGNPKGTLVNALLARYGRLEADDAGGDPGEAGGDGDALEFGDDVRPGIVHRLDKDTTGLLVVARTAFAGAGLRRQIAMREMSRRYLALVRGSPPERFTVDAPIGRTPDRRRMAVVEGGRPARSHVERREQFPGDPPYALLEVRLETGRTHQIRVHLAFAGYPLAGDRLYGRPALDAAAGLELPGQALHAYRLELEHPVSGERLALEAPLPPDFDAALERLRARVARP
jgi:23S rRNA pseudouridine1911/1915/1917 synthase